MIFDVIKVTPFIFKIQHLLLFTELKIYIQECVDEELSELYCTKFFLKKTFY
jgi:hypothetical protein